MIRQRFSLRYFTLVITALALVTFAAAACNADETREAAAVQDTEDLLIVSPGGTEHHFNVEIAATPDAAMRGLMFREKMDEDHGMLFMFPQEKDRNFWMHNTLIPLDIIFINADGSIRHIHDNAVPLDDTPIPSTGPVQMVLEINGGVASKLGIKPGDMVYVGSTGK